VQSFSIQSSTKDLKEEVKKEQNNNRYSRNYNNVPSIGG
jgi:hypothetical protein